MWQRGAIVHGLLGFAWIVISALAGLPAYVVGIHQRSVTHSLAEWEREYSDISSLRDAIRAAEMLSYAQDYYRAAEGYRSTPPIEAALEAQRADTVHSIVAALRDHTGKDFETDAAQWLAYLLDYCPAVNRPQGALPDRHSATKTMKGW